MRPHLTIDPAVQFGRPCIPETRVTAEAVAGCVAAGDSVDDVAHDYGVSRESVILACWWYANEPKGRGKWDRAVLAAWGADHVEWSWADRTIRSLGNHPGAGPLTDPPEVVR